MDESPWSVTVRETGGTPNPQFRVYFALDDNDNGADDHMGYYSSNNSNAANHPQLVVTYIP